MGRGIRKKLRLSKLYTFIRFYDKKPSSVKEDESEIVGPGFSRIVYCNYPDCLEARIRNYGDNYVRTTKYTLVTFLPKSLFEQFRRVANFYFLLTGVLALTPLTPYTAVSAIVPLSIIIAASMMKEGIEDWRRKQQDIEVNGRKVKVHQGNGFFSYTEWRHLKVGDIVKVDKDEFFPADLLLLSSSYEDAICYVETMNLDGETNLKPKQGLVHTSSFYDDSNFKNFEALVRCEDPNANLYSFVGSMEYEMHQHALAPRQLLLRDSKLRNTDYIYGAVIFNGHDTKVMQNSTNLPSKRSKIELKMDRIIYVMFFIVFMMSFIGSILFGIWTKDDIENRVLKSWYLRPDDTTIFFDPKNAPAASIFHLFSVLMLYNYFIPLSLYVSIEIVKVLQSIFISKDTHLYYKETDKPAHARTSNLNEELGQVGTILTDKTGTLTCNSMEFVRCSIAGTAYGGDNAEEVERKRTSIRGFNFSDERIINGNWIKEPQVNVIEKFFRLLALCHTVIPEIDERTGDISYEAESPDEAAFVVAAKEIGFEFYTRTQTSISVREMDLNSRVMFERVYQLLNVLEFNSSRKRMSVIVRDEEGKLLLLCKGADSVMFERLANDDRELEEKTMDHVKGYADAGLRTLILAYKELDEEVYEKFKANFNEAKNSITADRDLVIDKVAEEMERDLKLLGATAVEDKLQDGVPECIEKLAQAGIKIWVLTGDKMETAINIGFSCRLLRPAMKEIIITLEDPTIRALEKGGDEKAVKEASKESVLDQIIRGKALVAKSAETLETALIIDGKSLTYALEDDTKEMFLQLAMDCASVICCRSSPKQKAMVTRLVKLGIGKTTLAIGDGANDVGMLQEANIGVGISGVEGMQAVMSSDIAIAQFRYLRRLLLVHGHWCYRRVSVMICYFFYKNIAFGFTLFLCEAHASFSAQPAYNDWFLSLYSVIFTSLPAITLGICDQDVSAATCLKFPLLYQEGVKNVLFSWHQILIWMFNGILSAVIIFSLCINTLEYQAFTSDGHVATRDIFGATMYTCIVWTVNLQIALTISYFTWGQHWIVWGSIIAWYIFLLVYGAINPTRSTTAYKVFVETLAPTPSFWLVTLFVAISALLPFFIFSAIRKQFFPMYHELLQEKEREIDRLQEDIDPGNQRTS